MLGWQGPTVEGAEAGDVNRDGWLDLYVGSHLFINSRDGSFSDETSAFGLSAVTDEGMKFVDWNGDGLLDILLLEPTSGLVLWQQVSDGFVRRQLDMPDTEFARSWGLWTDDFDSDGLDDVIISGSANNGQARWPVLSIRRGDTLIRQEFMDESSRPEPGDLVVGGDVNQDGAIDVLSRNKTLHLSINSKPPASFLKLTVVDQGGRRNQQGRQITVRDPATGLSVTRLVDGGSGYLSASSYEVTIPLPRADATFDILVNYADSQTTFQASGGRFTVYPHNQVFETAP
jgi:hypothetical protein